MTNEAHERFQNLPLEAKITEKSADQARLRGKEKAIQEAKLDIAKNYFDEMNELTKDEKNFWKEQLGGTTEEIVKKIMIIQSIAGLKEDGMPGRETMREYIKMRLKDNKNIPNLLNSLASGGIRILSKKQEQSAITYYQKLNSAEKTKITNILHENFDTTSNTGSAQVLELTSPAEIAKVANVSAFSQIVNGLSVDGKIGPETMKKYSEPNVARK